MSCNDNSNLLCLPLVVKMYQAIRKLVEFLNLLDKIYSQMSFLNDTIGVNNCYLFPFTGTNILDSHDEITKTTQHYSVCVCLFSFH